ncbi:TPA: bacteriocin immunity protein [Klebsiella pneumoniae]|uniref:bacteriocin immunity protein n=1 Tax=Klebsiella TaxID=570 RepID=UPI00069E471C|nr:bacteriocin immunity protein [Klebsiella pneumoniae]MBD7686782.1 bacteriocin immunity protein [Klebsiella pneumoniae]MBE5272680.1 bacteriocin immunity protein [Klebsiella pneumoniae]MBG1936823.1 bacteriocin immunity protein [Klebsiella pneumoniae]MBS9484692.1 bacteriocin immunity protein [Klebsiella pneumoniae]MBS9520170.1 bacteriocin immunity protein [Klebsiella pneumoniae]
MIDVSKFKDNLNEFTVKEFIIYLNEFYSDLRFTPSSKGLELEEYLDTILDEIISVVGTVKAGDFIYHPSKPENDSPEGVIEEIIKWRKSQGLSLFKDS